MKKFLILIFAAAFLLSAFSPAEAGGRKGDPTPPRLISPTDQADLKPGQDLEFRWSSEGDRSGFRYYDFRLYKGAKTIESGLLLKEEVPGGKTSFSVPSDTFQNGETYSWSVRLVGSKKSRSVYSVFKVNKA